MANAIDATPQPQMPVVPAVQIQVQPSGWRPGQGTGTAPMTGAERNPYGAAPPPASYPMKLGG